MNHILGVSDLTLWITLTIGRVLVCLSIVQTRFFRRLPWFSVYIAGSIVENLLLIVFAFWGSYAVYYWTFYGAGYLELLLGFVALIECARQVFPGLDLPNKKEAKRWLLAGIVAVAAFTISWPMATIESAINLGLCLAIGVGFIFVTIYSRQIGLYRSRLVAGISSALGVLYLAEAAARATMGQFPVAYVGLRRFIEVANILAVLAWIIVILSPWGEVKVTQADLTRARQILSDAEDNLRHVASGGAK